MEIAGLRKKLWPAQASGGGIGGVGPLESYDEDGRALVFHHLEAKLLKQNIMDMWLYRCKSGINQIFFVRS